MKAKEIIKEHKGIIIVVALVLLLAGGWYYMWSRIAANMTLANYETGYEQFTFEGAHYLLCDSASLRSYLPDAAAADESLCGERIGEMSFPSSAGTVSCPLYACKAFGDAAPCPLVIAERSGQYAAYELAGFASLDESPSAADVCAAYGIAGAETIEQIEVRDADGTLLEVITDAEALGDFCGKLTKLGADIGEAGLAKAYYDAYSAEYGETGKLTLAEGVIQYADDESYQQAMEFWCRGMCLMTIKLKSGLQLKNAVYAPVPGVFSLYGDYAFTDPLLD